MFLYFGRVKEKLRVSPIYMHTSKCREAHHAMSPTFMFDDAFVPLGCCARSTGQTESYRAGGFQLIGSCALSSLREVHIVWCAPLTHSVQFI